MAFFFSGVFLFCSWNPSLVCLLYVLIQLIAFLIAFVELIFFLLLRAALGCNAVNTLIHQFLNTILIQLDISSGITQIGNGITGNLCRV